MNDSNCRFTKTGNCVGGVDAGLPACVHDKKEAARIERWYQAWLVEGDKDGEAKADAS